MLIKISEASNGSAWGIAIIFKSGSAVRQPPRWQPKDLMFFMLVCRGHHAHRISRVCQLTGTQLCSKTYSNCHGGSQASRLPCPGSFDPHSLLGNCGAPGEWLYCHGSGVIRNRGSVGGGGHAKHFFRILPDMAVSTCEKNESATSANRLVDR